MQKVKQFVTQFAWEFIGSVFIPTGIYNFAVQAKFPMTGFSGISIILYRLLNIPIGLSTIALNIPLAMVCYRLLGKKFFVSSLRCMVLSSLMIDYVGHCFRYMKEIVYYSALHRCIWWNRLCFDLFEKFFYRWFGFYYYGSKSNQTTFIIRKNRILV